MAILMSAGDGTSMNWSRLLTTQRYGHEDLTPGEAGRSHFHKDHDRIIFSSAFRRLGRKTQVHPFALNDHIHTRLTHSIEVGSVGRSLGIRVGDMLFSDLPDWVTPHDLGMIVQSACLAHDIGNPPFGHAGEYAIRDWFESRQEAPLLSALTSLEFQDLATFEGNAQGFRVVTRIENHLFQGGLRLTYPTLGALLKYPWGIENISTANKFSAFQSEIEILDALGRDLGLVRGESGRWCRHPLAFLVEAADDICYAILDLEDAVELNLLSFEDVKSILLMLCGDLDFDDDIFMTEASARRKISALRGKAMENMVSSVVETFRLNYDAIMSGSFDGELLLRGDKMVCEGIKTAKQIARDRVFPDTRKAELEVGAYASIGILLDAFLGAVFESHCRSDQKMSYKSRKILRLMGIHAPSSDIELYSCYRRVLDFISGMTDNYASYLARQISGNAF